MRELQQRFGKSEAHDGASKLSNKVGWQRDVAQLRYALCLSVTLQHIVAVGSTDVDLARTPNTLLTVFRHLQPLRHQPTDRAIANMTVNMFSGIFSALKIMPE